MKPFIYLANWSSTGHHGPGPRLTIMAAPRAWEHGEGAVAALTPDLYALRALRQGAATWDVYETAFRARAGAALADGSLQPGPGLQYQPRHRLDAVSASAHAANRTTFSVPDGATLCCACSNADAASGRCHRTWAAEYLDRAGWHVLLGGKPFTRETP